MVLPETRRSFNLC